MHRINLIWYQKSNQAGLPTCLSSLAPSERSRSATAFESPGVSMYEGVGSLLPLGAEEKSQFFCKALRRRLAFDQYVVLPLQRDKTGSGNCGCDLPSELEWNTRIAACVHDQRRTRNLRHQYGDVDFSVGLEDARCAFRRRRDPLQFVETVDLFFGSSGNEPGRDHLPDRGLFLASPSPYQAREGGKLVLVGVVARCLERPQS